VPRSDYLNEFAEQASEGNDRFACAFFNDDDRLPDPHQADSGSNGLARNERDPTGADHRGTKRVLES